MDEIYCSVLKVQKSAEEASVDGGEGTPVPMPNTEVKLTCAESTWMETSWEDR